MPIFDKLVSSTIMHTPGPIVHLFARNYIAGKTLDDAVQACKKLNAQGALGTIDILGEFITRREESDTFRNHCLSILDAIAAHDLDANLSLKPTQMGLELDKQLALDNIQAIVQHAKELGNFVRIDMEDTPSTDATLDIYRCLRTEFPGHVGTVLQAYLHRTSDDIEQLSDAPLNLRLCKGIYNEPRTLAWKQYDVINRSFTVALEQLFKHKAYVGIATHDTRLVFEALRLIREYGLKRDDYEFQMLLGVDEELRQMLLDGGHRLRVYIPYGEAWLPYSRRRLKENPSIARHAVRQMLGLH